MNTPHLTSEQEQKIIRYLLDKKLTLDVASEVFDHMTLQISSLMSEEDLSFDEAWRQTCQSWLGELQTTYDVLYSLDDITYLMKDLQKKQWKKLLKTCLPISCGLSLLTLLLIWWVPTSALLYLLLFFCGGLLALAVFAVVKGKSLWKLQKQYTNNRLFLGFDYSFLPAALFGGVLSLFANLENWKSLQLWLNEGNFTLFSFFILAATFMGFTFMYTGVSLFLLHYQQNIAKLEQLKPFLEKIKQA